MSVPCSNSNTVTTSVYKRFFGYNKYDSATAVFMELKLPTANTVLHNHRFLFEACWKNHTNSIVSLIRNVYRPTPLS